MVSLHFVDPGTLFLRLGIALGLSFLVGLERRAHDRPAGIRTHVLVCVGACLYMLVSLAFGEKADAARVAANVVVGIGFLGAGTIIRHGTSVLGLTTAAGLWVVAAIGLAVGMGWYLGAVGTTAIALLTLGVLRIFEQWAVARRGLVTLTVTVRDAETAVGPVIQALAECGARIGNLTVERGADAEPDHLIIALAEPPKPSHEAIAARLAELGEVQGVAWG
jgi:putative Mg2+ transporter-C (MgtC) family protein